MRKTLIIAEAGVNHNGSLEMARKLVDAAVLAGVDIVKFQTFNVDAITSTHAEMADYQKKNTGNEKSQKEMLRELMLSEEEFVELAEYCRKKEIRFLSTPFDLPSISFLKGIGCDLWKIPSGEITNFPYLREIAKMKDEVILSTGMSTMEEVEAAVSVLKEYGTEKITLLHCTTEYPTPFEDVNLKAMLSLGETFGYQVGYSDHTKGIEVPIAAVAMGAAVIEKHFTLDKELPGPDHKASLEPDELRAMVSAIRNIEQALGDGVKIPAASEIGNKKVARKSIVASKAIKAGEVFTEENLTTKRPGNGINPMCWNAVLGKCANRDFDEDELIEI